MMKLVGAVAVSMLLTGCGCEVVDTGRRGIKTEFGKIEGEPLGEGLHWYNPFSEDIFEMSVREQKLEDKTACFTRDTQNVIVQYAITYFPKQDRIGALYQQFGEDWDEKIIAPIVLQSLKDTIGRYAADDLVSKREEATKAAFDEVAGSLAKRDVIATTLSITNLDFDDKYESAVEEKVVAIQKAAGAKNRTVEVEEKAKQRIIAAEAEARSMTIRSQALKENKGLVEYEAVQKWDGKLPQQMFGNAVPFINVSRQ